VTTAVTCPTRRIHPAIVAQAAATSAVLHEGRFVLGVGSGEAISEVPLGLDWPDPDEKLARLTPREEQILSLVASGKTNGQIAKEIFLSEKTVKNHVSTILGKLEVARRTEATAYLVRHTVQTG